MVRQTSRTTVSQCTSASSGTKRISVAMTTYNGASFIKEQMDSICFQLTADDEIIVSDDGSTDETLQILKSYQNGTVPVRIIEGPKAGIKKNVENALMHCSGQYIFLADQDDIWFADKVNCVLECFADEKINLVIHDAVVFSEDTNKPVMDSFFAFRNAKAGILKNIWKNSYIGCCMAFRATLLKQALPIPSNIEMHDQWLGILNDFYYKKSYFLNKPLLYYRRHSDNNSAMVPYSTGKRLKNRLIFIGQFLRRIL
ncbi:MAG: glycosyltransferase [Lachnospiraceae bacterium]|nr:glycosyltransferase [Lachnospiraceae bacterium]